MWIKNTSGKPDSMLTFATFAFIVVTINILLSTFGVLDIKDFHFEFKALDGGIMAVYLGATFSAYVSRKWTDTHYRKVSGEEKQHDKDVKEE